MTTVIVSADQACRAVQAVLEEHLADSVTALGWDLLPVQEWQQLPTLEAVSSAVLPAVSIACSRLNGEPTYHRHDQAYRVTLRIEVGVYYREPGVDHSETAKAARDYAAAIRLTVLSHPRLGGLARGLRWPDEEYRLVPNRNSARTFAAAAVSFDVDVLMAASISSATPGRPDDPLVQSTPTELTVHHPGGTP